MNCPKCGKPVDQDAVFCGNCGQALTQTTPITGAQSVPPTPTQIQNNTTQVAPDASATPPIASVAPLPSANNVPPSQPIVSTPPVGNAPVAPKGETRAIVGLILGVASIPGAILPIAGVPLSIAAIIIGTLSIRIKKVLAVLAIIFGALGMIASIASFIYGFNYVRKHPSTAQKVSVSDSQTIDTSCFSFRVDKSWKVQADNSSCKVKITDQSTDAESSMSDSADSFYDDNTTSDNFAANAAANIGDIMNDINSNSQGKNFTIQSQQSSTFAGQPSYEVEATDQQGGKYTIELVYYNAANGNNIFDIEAYNVYGDNNMPAIESSFNWK